MDDRSVPGSRIDMVGLCKPYGVDRCLRRKPITSFLKSSWNADRSKPGASSQSLLGRFLRMVSVQGGRKEKWMPFETSGIPARQAAATVGRKHNIRNRSSKKASDQNSTTEPAP